MIHQPVLLKEVLYYLNPLPGGNFIDCTVGFGGHALPILKQVVPDGKVLGIELDEKVLEILREKKMAKELILIQGNFADLKKLVKKNNFQPVNGILFDLGMSSWQIEKSGRGFSFQKDEPLIMRYAPQGLAAEEIVNQWSEKELIKILKEYGQERYARRIAQGIVQARRIKPIKTTSQLVKIIRQAVPIKYRQGRLHFASRTFQAFRIVVNSELNNLEKALPQALEVLESGDRLVVISFHSLEDRIVKNFFRQATKENQLNILTKKPIRPSQEEIRLNPRSRSARLRAATKT